MGAAGLLGFRDAHHAAGAALLSDARVATDDGSVGHPARSPICCSPSSGSTLRRGICLRSSAMLEAVRAISDTGAMPAQLAMESGMACGYGACFGCVVETKAGYVRLCVDGPVLEAPTRRARSHDRASCGNPRASLASPIINASGTFDAIAARRAFGDALLARFPFAAYVTKTVTIAPRQGNPPPRLYELPAGLMNSIGLPNKGLEGFLAEDLPKLAELPVPLIVNVMGNLPTTTSRGSSTGFGERDEVAALELNVSCPNVKTGLTFGADPREAAGCSTRCRPGTGKPMIVKLTPNCAAPADVAAAAEQHGADAVALDQHAARHGASTRNAGQAVARRRHGGVSRARGARDRARAGRRGPRTGSAMGFVSAWVGYSAAVTPTTCCSAGADLVARRHGVIPGSTRGREEAAELAEIASNQRDLPAAGR